MDFELVLKFMYDFAFFLSLFAVALAWCLFIGRQSLINVLVGSFIALLLFIQFPFQDRLLQITDSTLVKALLTVGLYVLLVLICTYIIRKVMPLEFYEGKFENMGKKIFLASSVTILNSVLCFSILPILNIVAIETPLQSLLTEGYLQYYLMSLSLGLLITQ
jgi:hypothetical protein